MTLVSEKSAERRLLIFELAVIIPTVAGGVLLVLRNLDSITWEQVGVLVLWAAAVSLVELIPCRPGEGFISALGSPS